MVVGVLTLDLFIPDSGSLKSKRFILKSLKDRLKNKFNISIAEQRNNLWQRSSLYVACVSNETKHLNIIFENVKNMIDREPLLEILDYSIEIF